jgi:hypothetical protein
MAGNLALKTGTAVTVTSAGGSTTSGTATSAGTVDLRSAGTSNLIEELQAFVELTCQWATITSIAAGTIAADIYLVPALDGTNYATVDTTSGSSYIASTMRVGSCVVTNTPTAATNYQYVTAPFDLFPALYTVYILNRSGQTISANWALKILPCEAQYT